MEHRDDGRAIPFIQIREELHDLDLVAEVEVDGRLVEHEDGRRLRDGHREQDELALAQGQLAGVATEQVADADPIDGSGNGRTIGRAKASDGVLVRQSTEGDDLLDGRRERQGRQLGHDGQPARDGQSIEAGEGGAAELDRSGAGLDEPGDRPKQGRLTGAVRADERDALPGADVEVDVAEGRPPAVGDGQPLRSDGGGRRAVDRSSRRSGRGSGNRS